MVRKRMRSMVPYDTPPSSDCAQESEKRDEELVPVTSLMLNLWKSGSAGGFWADKELEVENTSQTTEHEEQIPCNSLSASV